MRMALRGQIQIMVVDDASARFDACAETVGALAKRCISSRVHGLTTSILLAMAPVQLAASAYNISRVTKVKRPQTLQSQSCTQDIGFTLVAGRVVQNAHDQEQQLEINNCTKKIFISSILQSHLQSEVNRF
ncbi:hypothetical protein [uncultured Tateyamaria sp.]|uniref:hypothetical protein n=2 Tax=uncultured Tateyamaria sp. TaxID=455651 RepID=UPI0026291963|nr:hypothetical protein [uncultured Tateyamaria sp.]